MRIDSERKLARKTPVYDHADNLLYHADREKTSSLMARMDIDIIGSTKRVHGIRFRGPDPALKLLSGATYHRPIGTPHKRDNYYNVRGMWHLDRIPEYFRSHFVVVLTDCMTEAS
jgi:hypothetical protein